MVCLSWLAGLHLSLKESLQNELNLIDFVVVSTLFFWINDNILKSKHLAQQKKFNKLLQKSKTESYPEKVILTFPSMYFLILKRTSLRIVWTFAFHLRNLSMPTIWSILNCFIDNCVKEFYNFEILSNEDLDFVKTKTKETALSSFRQYNNKPQQNLSK